MHRIATTIALALLLSACNPPEPPARSDAFVIETDRLTIRVQGDPATFEQYAGQIMSRIDTVDPALIKPGIGVWAQGRHDLVRVGTVVAVEPRTGGY